MPAFDAVSVNADNFASVERRASLFVTNLPTIMRYLASLFAIFVLIGCSDDPLSINGGQQNIFGYWENAAFHVRMVYVSNDKLKTWVDEGPCFTENEFEVTKIEDRKIYYKGDDSPLEYRLEDVGVSLLYEGRSTFWAPFKPARTSPQSLNDC